jgi:hypothetical protein
MAIDKLRTDLVNLLNSPDTYDAITKQLKSQFKGWDGRFYEVDIKKNQLVPRVQKAVEDMVAQGTGNLAKYKKNYPKLFKKEVYRYGIDQTLKGFSKTTGGDFGKAGKLLEYTGDNAQKLKGIYRIKGTNKLFIANRNIYSASKRLREQFYHYWRKGAQQVMNRDYAKHQLEPKRGRINTPIAHDGDTTVFTDWLDQKSNEANAELKLNTQEFDLAQEIINALEIDFEEDTNLKGTKYTQKRVIRASLGPNNPATGKMDKPNRNRMVKALMNVKRGILAGKYPYLDKSGKAADVAASKPFKELATQAATRKAIESVVKEAKKNKLKVKSKTKIAKPKSKKRKANLKRSTGSKPKAQKISIPKRVAAAKIVQKKEKGDKGTGTSEATNLAKIKKYINSRLGAEVRRNMGRPALMNRTGRFSNSVELLSLTEGQNTIVAKYTYLLNPYATFENAGKRRWPLAYNPKPLIAKSIRNLAEGRIEQKLTVRRV